LASLMAKAILTGYTKEGWVVSIGIELVDG